MHASNTVPHQAVENNEEGDTLTHTVAQYGTDQVLEHTARPLEGATQAPPKVHRPLPSVLGAWCAAALSTQRPNCRAHVRIPASAVKTLASSSERRQGASSSRRHNGSREPGPERRKSTMCNGRPTRGGGPRPHIRIRANARTFGALVVREGETDDRRSAQALAHLRARAPCGTRGAAHQRPVAPSPWLENLRPFCWRADQALPGSGSPPSRWRLRARRACDRPA